MAERFTIFTVPAGAALDLGNDTGRRDVIVLAPSCLPAPEFLISTTRYLPYTAGTTVTPGRVEIRAQGFVVAPYSWVVKRTHTTLALSLTFERDHIATLAASYSRGQFQLVRTVAGVQMRSVGSLVRVQCVERVGVATTWVYHWQGTVFGP